MFQDTVNYVQRSREKKLSCEEIVPAICNVQLLFSYHFHIVSEYTGMNILLQ